MPAKIPPSALAGANEAESVAQVIYWAYEWTARNALVLDTDTEVNLKLAWQIGWQFGPKLQEFMAKANTAAERRAVLAFFDRKGVDYANPAGLLSDLVAARDAALAWKTYTDANMPEIATSGFAMRIADATKTDGSREDPVMIAKTAGHATAISTLRATFE